MVQNQVEIRTAFEVLNGTSDVFAEVANLHYSKPYRYREPHFLEMEKTLMDENMYK